MKATSSDGKTPKRGRMVPTCLWLHKADKRPREEKPGRRQHPSAVRPPINLQNFAPNTYPSSRFEPLACRPIPAIQRTFTPRWMQKALGALRGSLLRRKLSRNPRRRVPRSLVSATPPERLLTRVIPPQCVEIPYSARSTLKL